MGLKSCQRALVDVSPCRRWGKGFVSFHFVTAIPVRTRPSNMGRDNAYLREFREEAVVFNEHVLSSSRRCHFYLY